MIGLRRSYLFVDVSLQRLLSLLPHLSQVPVLWLWVRQYHSGRPVWRRSQGRPRRRGALDGRRQLLLSLGVMVSLLLQLHMLLRTLERRAVQLQLHRRPGLLPRATRAPHSPHYLDGLPRTAPGTGGSHHLLPRLQVHEDLLLGLLSVLHLQDLAGLGHHRGGLF